jgi:RNA polymerase sigma-70 factor (ECF subfamily)
MDEKSIPSALTNASLLNGLNQGGPEREAAWRRFYLNYVPIISAFARRLGVRGHDVDELVHEVIGAFFGASPEFTYDPTKGRFRSYLKTCVCHKLMELRRKRERWPTASLPDQLAAPESAVVESIWEDVWETGKLGRAMEIVRKRYSINEDRRRTFRAFELCKRLDRPTSNVATELGMTVENVRQACSRVGKALLIAFDELEEFAN